MLLVWPRRGRWLDASILMFTGLLVAVSLRPDAASGSQFARGNHPTLAGSKCLGSGELRRPAEVDLLRLVVTLEVSSVFRVPTCPPPRSPPQQYVVLRLSRFPLPLPPGRRRGQQLPPCLYIDNFERLYVSTDLS